MSTTPRFVVQFWDGRYRVVDTQDDDRVVAWTYFHGTAVRTCDSLNKGERAKGDK